jgi:predicted MPP superfamily phosphohydrolase
MLIEGLRRAITGPHVKTVEIHSAQLPQALDGFRIAQISDLHVGPTIGRRYVERVVRLTNSLTADLVALTGDIGDGAVQELERDLEPLNALSPRGRIYYVTGNHEYYWIGRDWVEKFRELGAKPLLNDAELIEHNGAALLVGGVIDPAASMATPGATPDAHAACRKDRPADFRILLAHQPGIAEKAEHAGFDLQLSGHTHGGQFFPWTLVVRHVHRYHLGLFKHGKMHVYVNAGTGTWGPPIRFGTRPEITLIVLRALPPARPSLQSPSERSCS